MTTETRYKSEVEKLLDAEEITAPGVHKTDVPYDLARRAHEGTSWEPEDRAHRQQLDYVRHMNSVWDDVSKRAKTTEQQLLAKEEFERYRRGYLARQLGYLNSHSHVVSSFIAGPSKFPTRTMEKRNNALSKRLNEWMEWDQKAQKAIKKKLDPTIYAISSDRADAPDLLKKKLEGLEKAHAIMVESNKIIRSKDDKEDKVKRIMALGLSEGTARKVFEPDFTGHVGFPDWQLSNSNANIKRIKDRIQSLEKSRGDTSREIQFANGTLTDSVEDNRVQLAFHGKPDSQTITKLKSHGFHWTPSLGVWQRMRSPTATYYAEEIAGVKLPAKSQVPAGAEETAVKMPDVEIGEHKAMAGSGAPQTEQKEPWEMTRREFKDFHRPPGRALLNVEAYNLAHREQVKEALAAGKPVPAEVLKDYPELRREEKPTANSNSQMYQHGYDFATKQATYIPDYKTAQEKVDFEAGLKRGYEVRDRKPVSHASGDTAENRAIHAWYDDTEEERKEHDRNVTIRTVADHEHKEKPRFSIHRKASGAGRGRDLGADIVKDRRGRHLRL